MLYAGAAYEVVTSDMAEKYAKIAMNIIDSKAKEALGESNWNALMEEIDPKED